MLIKNNFSLFSVRFKIIISFLFFYILPVSADNISEFQIEGMSIGDSLLNYFDKDYILREFEIGKDEYGWTDQKFTDVYKYGGMNLYDNVKFSVKRKDNNYIIYAITGQITYNNINDCLNKQKEIDSEFKYTFKNLKRYKYDHKHSQDKTNKSHIYRIEYEFKTKDIIEIVCFDLSKNMKQPSGLDIGIKSWEYYNWLNNF